MIQNTSVPRALKRLCAKHRASAKAEVRENAKYKCGLGFESNFAGGRIRKTETNAFEIRRDLGFRPRRRVRRNAGGFLLASGHKTENTEY